MSAPPGGSFLPFMTSVTTDIYERIDKLSQSLATVTDTLKVIIVDIKDNFEKKQRKQTRDSSEINKEGLRKKQRRNFGKGQTGQEFSLQGSK